MPDYRKGYKYQRSVTGYLASELSKDERVKDYHVFYKLPQFHPFDDIVLAINYHDSEELRLICVQVKSGKINNRKIATQLTTKYLDGYNRIKNSSKEYLEHIGKINKKNIQFWFFACDNLSSDTISFQQGSETNNLQIKRRISDINESIIYDEAYELFSKDEDIENEHQQFFNDFYIFLKQPNSYVINSKLQDTWKSSNADEIVEYIGKYFNRNKKGSLSKTLFEHELLKICLSDSIVIPTKIIPFPKESALAWNNLILSCNVGIVKSKSDIESILFACILQSISNNISVAQWNTFVDKGGKLSRKFRKQFPPELLRPDTVKDLLIHFWAQGVIPLVIKTNNPLPLLKEFSHLNRHYIIIDSEPDKRYEEIETYSLTSIKNLGNTHSDQLLQSIMVSMQGGKSTSLYEVINGDQKLMEALTCLDILKLMEPKQVYVGNDYMLFILETANPEPIDYEKYEPNGENICVYCPFDQSSKISEDIREHPKFQNYKIYRLQLPDSKQLPPNRHRRISNPLDIENIKPFTIYENKLHKSIKELETFLIDQHGNSLYSISEDTMVPIMGKVTRMSSINYLPRYMRKGIVVDDIHVNAPNNEAAGSNIKFTKTTFSENEFFKKMEGKICVVTGEAGIGKTTFLQSLRQICSPQHYVLFYNLVRIQNEVTENRKKLFQNPLNFLWKKQRPPTYGHFLNVFRKGRKRVILILDSFDEVILTCKEQVLELIRNLDREACLEKIIIGGTLLTIDMLSKEFDIEVAKIEEFNNDNNFHYLANWSFDENSLKELPREFTSNPLYLDMLREISQTSEVDFQTLTRWTLYERIVDSKIERYCQQMGVSFNDNKKNILKFHGELAVKLLSGCNQVTDKFLANTEKNNFSKLGFIKYFNKKEEPVFVHHTFAEFFAANWLFEHTDRDDIRYIYRIISNNREFDVLSIRSDEYFNKNGKSAFAHHTLADFLAANWSTNATAQTVGQLPLHKAVLNASAWNNDIGEEIEQLCTQNSAVLTQVDDFGRTALHIAAIQYDPQESICLEKIIHQYMRQKDRKHLYLRDKLLYWTWIDYLENKSWFSITKASIQYVAMQEAYWSYYKSQEDEIRSPVCQPADFNLLHKKIIRSPSVFSIIGDMLSVQHFDNANFRSFRQLCSSYNLLGVHLSKDFGLHKLKLTRLHLAIIYCNRRVASACLEDGDNVDAQDIFGCTPLYYSIGQQQSQLVKLLLDHNTDVTLQPDKKSGFSVFQLALQTKNEGIIKMLIEKSDMTKFGSIWLCDAIQFGDIEVIQTLLGANANPNGKVDVLGYTLFDKEICIKNILEAYKQYCARNYDVNAMTVHELLLFVDGANRFLDAELSSLKEPVHAVLPLNVAIHARRKDIVQLLLRNHADVNLEIKCEDKLFNGTPLCWAIRHRTASIVELLLQNHAGANYMDTNGLRPLKLTMKEDEEQLIHFISDQQYFDIFLVLIKKYNADAFDKNNFLKHLSKYDWSQNNPKFLEKKLQIVAILLGHGADVNLKDNDDLTLLDDALVTQNWRMAEILLRNEAKPYNMKQFDFTSILAVVPTENIKLIELFLKNGANANFNTECKVTPLYVAAIKRNPDMVKLLLEYGAHENIITCTSTLVAIAKEKGTFDVVRWLCDLSEICLGSSIVVSAYPTKAMNLIETVTRQAYINLVQEINITSQACNRELVERLLHYAGNLSNPNGLKYVNAVLQLKNQSVDEILLDHFKNHHSMDIRKYTAVGCAAKRRHKAIIEILTRNGEHVNSVNTEGRTALVSVIDRNMDKSDVDFLLEVQADVNLADANGNTPLITAIECGKRNVVKILLENNAIVNYVDKHGLTPLIASINKKNSKMTRILLDNGADVNFVSDCGLTPLYSAVMSGHNGIINMLLSYEPRTDVETCGNTLLFNAIKLGYVEVVCLLLSKKLPNRWDSSNYKYQVVQTIILNAANVNAINEFGVTPLHLATEMGYFSIVQLLLSHNADQNQVDTHRRTALHYAAEMNKENIVRELLEKGAEVNIKDNNCLTPFDCANNNKEKSIQIIGMLETKSTH